MIRAAGAVAVGERARAAARGRRPPTGAPGRRRAATGPRGPRAGAPSARPTTRPSSLGDPGAAGVGGERRPKRTRVWPSRGCGPAYFEPQPPVEVPEGGAHHVVDGGDVRLAHRSGVGTTGDPTHRTRHRLAPAMRDASTDLHARRPPAGLHELRRGPARDRAVHGLLLSQRMHEPLAEALAERGNRVMTLDLLGHGALRPPAATCGATRCHVRRAR